MAGVKARLKRKLNNTFKMRYNSEKVKIIVKNRYKDVIICYINICWKIINRTSQYLHQLLNWV